MLSSALAESTGAKTVVVLVSIVPDKVYFVGLSYFRSRLAAVSKGVLPITGSGNGELVSLIEAPEHLNHDIAVC